MSGLKTKLRHLIPLMLFLLYFPMLLTYPYIPYLPISLPCFYSSWAGPTRNVLSLLIALSALSTIIWIQFQSLEAIMRKLTVVLDTFSNPYILYFIFLS